MKAYASFLLFGTLILCLSPLVSNAAEFRAGDEVSVTASSTDLYAAGGQVSISGNVEGDLNAAGGEVTVNAPVTSDVNVAGGNLSLLADVGDDLRAVGGQIRITGPIGDDAIVTGGQIQFLPSAAVESDLVVNGGTVTISNPVGGDVQANGGRIVINSEIQGDVTIKAGEIVIGSSGIIHGNLTYRAPQEAEMQSGSQVMGEIAFTPVEERSRAAQAIGAGTAIMFLMLLAAAIVLVLVFPLTTVGIVTRSIGNTWSGFGWSLLTGFVAAIVIPIAAIILMATVIGLPLGVLLLLGYIALWILSAALAGVLIGTLLEKWVLKRPEYVATWINTIVGVLVFVLLGFIPFIGGLIQCIFALTAFGALLKFWYEERWPMR